MIRHLDYYLKFMRQPDSATTRRDLVEEVGGYRPLLVPNKHGRVFLYVSQPINIRAQQERKGSLRITQQGKHVSSLFFPELSRPELAIGDVQGYEDALLFCFSDRRQNLEILVSKGAKTTMDALYSLLADDQLQDEIEFLRAQAQPFVPLTTVSSAKQPLLV